MTKKKQKSKEKTKLSSSAAVAVSSLLPNDASLQEESDHQESPVDEQQKTSDGALLKSTKRKKKRKRKETTTTTSPVEESSKQPAKKKKKSKQKSEPEVVNQGLKDAPDSDEVGSDPSPTLQGCMVDDIMVLIDRQKGKVYSATEVSESGDRKEVGKVGDDGTVILFAKQQTGKHFSCSYKRSALSHVSKPAGTFFPSSLIGQISCQSSSLQGGTKKVSSCLPTERLGVTFVSTALRKRPQYLLAYFLITETDFPFATDSDDHCESPLQAYQDISPFMKAIRGTPPSNLSIYDPYFCNGAVVQNLESMGFPNVYNRKEDCYEVWASSSRYPSHDVLITNPPYSGDHIENLVNHITSPSFGNRPWMLLLPQWVHKKDYYLAKTKHIRPFYLVPQRRYVYLPPPSFREAKKSDVHKKSSPFVSMWFIWGGTTEQNDRWLSSIAQRITTCDVARSKSALRDLRRKGSQKK